MLSVEADFEIQKITDFETLEKTCRMLNPNPKKHGLKKLIFFGSEIGKWAARDTAWENTDLIKKFQTVRKIGLCMLTDAIDRVDKRIVSPRFFAGLFEKPFKRNKKFAIFEDWTTGKFYKFKDIPKTRIEYDTYEEAEFHMHPLVPEDAVIPLNYEHDVIKKYMESGSWKAINIHPQEGKRCQQKVNEYHFTHCLPHISKEDETKEIPATSEQT
jgi:hypothetical protein